MQRGEKYQNEHDFLGKTGAHTLISGFWLHLPPKKLIAQGKLPGSGMLYTGSAMPYPGSGMLYAESGILQTRLGMSYMGNDMEITL